MASSRKFLIFLQLNLVHFGAINQFLSWLKLPFTSEVKVSCELNFKEQRKHIALDETEKTPFLEFDVPESIQDKCLNIKDHKIFTLFSTFWTKATKKWFTKQSIVLKSVSITYTKK